MLSRLARSWIERSEKIRELVAQLRIPLITYEQFCRDPSSVKDALNTPDGVADSIDPDADVVVKDYTVQPVTDQNDRQIANLRDGERKQIRDTLHSSESLLRFFGYQLGH